MRIADAPPPVDLEPVTPLAGYGMELRLWALDATAWKRSQHNAELEQLYRSWQAIEAERERAATEDQTPAGVQPEQPSGPEPAGPPIDDADDGPRTFEEFVRSRSVAAPDRPGSDALARYEDTRGAIDAQAETVWNENGLRFALVPIGELAALRDAMGVPGPLERTWWGATTTWSHMAKGIAAGDRRLETDLGPLSLGPGRLALVGRAWPAPGVSRPVLQLELCPQFLPHRSSASVMEARLATRLEAQSGPPSALAEGPVFERLMLRGSLPRGYALVIVPTGQPQRRGRVGPDVPASNLSEALLSAVGPDGAPRPVALVVVPVLPDWFSLDGG